MASGWMGVPGLVPPPFVTPATAPASNIQALADEARGKAARRRTPAEQAAIQTARAAGLPGYDPTKPGGAQYASVAPTGGYGGVPGLVPPPSITPRGPDRRLTPAWGAPEKLLFGGMMGGVSRGAFPFPAGIHAPPGMLAHRRPEYALPTGWSPTTNLWGNLPPGFVPPPKVGARRGNLDLWGHLPPWAVPPPAFPSPAPPGAPWQLTLARLMELIASAAQSPYGR